MPSIIERIRERIRSRDYFLSSHAEDEMAEDGFERSDVDAVILGGIVNKKLTHDARLSRAKAHNCGHASHPQLEAVVNAYFIYGYVFSGFPSSAKSWVFTRVWHSSEIQRL